MNDRAFWRIVWKESRAQQALWIAMGAATLAGQLLVLCWPKGTIEEKIPILFGTGLALAAFYALGCGATLFATEHETGTYEFQRALPVTAGQVFWGKLALAGASVAALMVLLWLTAWVLCLGRLPEPPLHGQLWALWGFAAVEMLLWGVFFSLRSARPLMAVVLAVTVASLSVHILSQHQYNWDMSGYVAALPWRALVAALVLAADAWQGKRWFDEPACVARVRRPAGPSAEPPRRSTAAPSAVLGRLIWQELHQSWKLLLAFAAMAVPVTLLLWSKVLHPSGEPEFVSWLPFPELLVPVIALLTILAIPLAGACVFLADQSGWSFRFLADRGVGPRAIWLSRQLVWAGAVVLIVLLLVCPPAFVIGLRVAENEPQTWIFLLLVPGFIFLAFSCGQLCSMFIRSGIVAAVVSVMLTASMCAWAGFMFMLNMSWFWSVAPLPVAFLAATWLWVPHWLVERSGWRSRVREIAPVVGPLLLILVAIPFVRVYQIPKVDPGVSLEESAHSVTPEEKATAELYLKAQGQMFEATGKLNRLAGSLAAAPVGNSPPGVATPSPAQFSVESPKNESDAALTKSEATWLQANQEALALVLQASQRTNPSFNGPFSLAPELTRLVVLSARQLESEGKLDAALDRHLAALRVCCQLWQRQWWQQSENLERSIYVRLVWWATRRGQTRERIVTAIRRLREAALDAPSPCEEIESGYRRTRQMLDNVADLKPASHSDDEPLLRFALRWLPWEKARVVRQLNFWTTECLADCRRWEKAATVNGQVILAEDDRTLRFADWDYVADVWVDYTPFARSWQAVNTGVANGETERRATQILLALEGWKTEHGRLPASLDKLVGPYFDALPNDPFTGKPFRYFPNGVPIPLTRHVPLTRGWMSPVGESAVARDTPFIWSAGWDLSEIGDELRDRRYPMGRWPVVSGDDIYQRAWIFTIPIR